MVQSAYHSGQKCVSVEVKLRILKERMAGRNDAKLIQELKRKEQDLLSLASIEVNHAMHHTVNTFKTSCLLNTNLLASQCSPYSCWAKMYHVTMSDRWDVLQRESKPCPVCAVPITKTEGCNKMTCTVCGQSPALPLMAMSPRWLRKHLLAGEVLCE